MIKSFLLEEAEKVTGSVKQLNTDDFPREEVLVKVAYSGLNYKDGMAVSGSKAIVRKFPHVPGIDYSGTVQESSSPKFKTGDKVILTGWGVGESSWGGYSQLASAKADWLVPMPNGLDERKAMILGTAGLTAMLCVMKLEAFGLRKGGKPILVTGASGGVGGVSVAILSGMGYDVVGVTGKGADFVKQLGAKEVISREEISATPKLLEKQKWGGAVDTVGGVPLARIIAELDAGASVAACGLAAAVPFPANVMPFILRGVNLLGVDSVTAPLETRNEAWQRLAKAITPEHYKLIEAEEIGLEGLPEKAAAILAGKIRGRVLVNPNL